MIAYRKSDSFVSKTLLTHQAVYIVKSCHYIKSITFVILLPDCVWKVMTFRFRHIQ
jgi:hypothetical protein